MTEHHDDFDRSLGERLRAYESHVPGASAPDLTSIGASSSRRPSTAWRRATLVAAGGVAAGLLFVLVLNGRFGPPTGDASQSPLPSSVATATPEASAPASVAPSPVDLAALPGLIAFSRDGDVYTMHPDGTEVSRLTDDPTSVAFPIAWLADGSKLVIGRNDNPGDPNAPYPVTLSLVMPDGTGAVDLGVVAKVWDSPPSYSPDGTMMAFTGDGTAGTGIAILNLVHGTLTQLTSDGGYGNDSLVGLLWSPDGTLIAYTASASDGISNDIWVVALDGSLPVTLAPDPTEDFPIRWTNAEGRLKLVFQSWRGTDQSKGADRPWVVNADGTDIQLLADSGLGAALANAVPPARISPDGRWAATLCEAILCLASTDGLGLTPIVDAQTTGWDFWRISPSWSPDSAFLAYSVVTDAASGRFAIKIASLDTGEIFTITGADASEWAPAWQPVPR